MRGAKEMAGLILLLVAMGSGTAAGAQVPQDNDHTLQAMRDEMARAKTRLELKIPNIYRPVRPYYVEYRLLDLEVREVVAEFGTLLSSTHTRNRFMDVQVRVGSYKLDSSNFVSDEGFRGFIGPLRFPATGLVDRYGSGFQRGGGDLFTEAGVSEQPGETIRH